MTSGRASLQANNHAVLQPLSLRSPRKFPYRVIARSDATEATSCFLTPPKRLLESRYLLFAMTTAKRNAATFPPPLFFFPPPLKKKKKKKKISAQHLDNQLTTTSHAYRTYQQPTWRIGSPAKHIARKPRPATAKRSAKDKQAVQEVMAGLASRGLVLPFTQFSVIAQSATFTVNTTEGWVGGLSPPDGILRDRPQAMKNVA